MHNAGTQSMKTRQDWILDPVRGIRVATPAAVMGIINVTPDSFSDGGHCVHVEQTRAQAQRFVADGAAWIDIGGESTRPGSQPVSAEQELARVVPAIQAVADLPIRVSIDTSKAAVAAQAISAGATMINDVTGGADPDMFAVAASARCPMVVMHMQGRPASMQVAPRYANVLDDVRAYFTERMAAAVRAGVAESALLLDPGIGFGKRLEDNLALLRALPMLLAEFNRPLVLGVSRKSMFRAFIGESASPVERDGISHVVHALCAPSCVLMRVHDVAGARSALAVALAIHGSVAA